MSRNRQRNCQLVSSQINIGQYISHIARAVATCRVVALTLCVKSKYTYIKLVVFGLTTKELNKHLPQLADTVHPPAFH
jgi:hypothetical protein